MIPDLLLTPHHRITLTMSSLVAPLFSSRLMRASKKERMFEVPFDTFSHEQSKQLIEWFIQRLERAPGSIRDVYLRIDTFLYDENRLWSQHEPFLNLLETHLSSVRVPEFLNAPKKPNEMERGAYQLILYYTPEHHEQNYKRLIEQAIDLNANTISSEACVCFTLPRGWDIDEALTRAGSVAPPDTFLALYQPLYDSNGFYMHNRTIFQGRSISPWAAVAKARNEHSLLDEQTAQTNVFREVRRL